MKVIDWESVAPEARATLLQRPSAVLAEEVRAAAARVIAQVRADGDTALRALTRRFDGVELGAFEVSADEFASAVALDLRETEHMIDAAGARLADMISHALSGRMSAGLAAGAGHRAFSAAAKALHTLTEARGYLDRQLHPRHHDRARTWCPRGLRGCWQARHRAR